MISNICTGVMNIGEGTVVNAPKFGKSRKPSIPNSLEEMSFFVALFFRVII